MVDTYQLLDKRLGAMIGFSGIIFLSVYDRILVYFLYKQFSIKVHSKLNTFLLSFLGFFIGCGVTIVGMYYSIICPDKQVDILGAIMVLILIIFFRWAMVKGNYAFFFLDDNFYLDRDGNDIRKHKNP